MELATAVEWPLGSRAHCGVFYCATSLARWIGDLVILRDITYTG